MHEGGMGPPAIRPTDSVSDLRRQIDDLLAEKNASDMDKDELRGQIEALRSQVYDAVHARIVAEGELAQSKSSRSSEDQSTSSLTEMLELQKRLDEVLAEKKAGEDAGAARERKMEADAADQKQKYDEQKLKFDADTAEQKRKFDEQKLKFDADTAEQKRRFDADKGYLRNRINELRKEVDAAVLAKKLAETQLDTPVTSTQSYTTSSSEEHLQKQVEDGILERRQLQEKIAALQGQIEDATQAKRSMDKVHKTAVDDAAAVKAKMEQKIGDLRQEVEEAVYSRFLTEQELEKAKKMSSDSSSDALLKQLDDLRALKEAADKAGASRERKFEADLAELRERKTAQKATSDAREKQLQDRLDTVLEEADEAEYRKLVVAGEHKAAMDIAAARERDLEEKLRLLKGKVEAAVYQKHLADEELDKVKASSSSQTDSSENEVLAGQLKASQDQITALLAQKKAVEDSAAAKEKVDQDDRDALQALFDDLKRQFDEAKSSKLQTGKEHKAAMDELRAKLEQMQGEVETATYAKYVAETELGQMKALSSSQGDTTDSDGLVAQLKASQDVVAALQSEKEAAAESASAKAKVDKHERDALQAMLGSLRHQLDEAKFAKLMTGEEHKAAIGQLQEKLKSLQGEVEAAVYQKHLADEELEKVKASTSSHTDDSENEALLAQLKAAQDDVALLRTEKKAVEDSAAAKAKVDKDDRDALQSMLDGLQQQLDMARTKRIANKETHDVVVKELQDKLNSMQEEVETAVYAKHLAETELDKVMASSSSGTSSDDQVSMLRKELYDSKIAGKAREDAGSAREKELRAKLQALQTIKEEAEAVAKVSADKSFAKEEELKRKVKFLQEEMEAAVFAKHEAEKERDKARSDSASNLSSSEAQLQKELEDLRASKKAGEDANAARERKLEAALEEHKALKKACDDAGVAREEALRAQLQALQDEADEAAYLKLQTAGQHKAAMDVAAAKEEELKQKLQSLQEEVKAVVYQKHLADEELERVKASSGSEASSSSDAIELAARLKASQDDAAEAKKRSDAEKDELHRKIESLRTVLRMDKDGRLKAAHDEAAEEKIRTDAQLKAARDDAAEAKVRFDTKKDDLEKKIESLQALLKSDKDSAVAEKRQSDESVLRLREELSLLKDQAAVLSSGKRAAEEEVRLMKVLSSEDGSSVSAATQDSLLLQQIEQLKAEKKLSKNLAAAMKRRLDSDKRGLQKKLATLQKKADELAFGKKEAEDKLTKVRESSESQTSSEAMDLANKMHQEMADLKAQKEAVRLELQGKIESLQTELKKARSSSSQGSTGDMQEQVNKLLQDVDTLKSEKEATAKRLEWEKSTKRDLRQKIISLQEHAEAAAKAKKASEDELKKLQEQPETQTTESMEELASQLRAQVQALQEEKEATLQKVQALEHAIATGQYDFGEGSRVREAYIEKLKGDIEMLETSVTTLMNENKSLMESKGRLEGEMGVLRGEEDKAKFCALDKQIKDMTGQTKTLEEKLNAALKEAGDARVAEKEEKDQVLDLQARMDKTILQLATLKSSTRMNMERIKEEHEEALRNAKESGAAEMCEELEALRQQLQSEEAERDKIRIERDALRKRLEAERVGRKAAEAATGSMTIDPKNFSLSSGGHGAVKKLHDEISRLEHSLKEANTKNLELQHSMESKLTKNQDELKRIQHSLKEADAKNQELQHSIKWMKSKDELRVNELEELKEKNAMLIKDLSELRSRKDNGSMSLETMGRKHEEEKRKLERENAALKASVKQCDTTMEHMRNEMVELKTTADATMARLEEKRKDEEKQWKEELNEERRKAERVEQQAKKMVLMVQEKNQGLQKENERLKEEIDKQQKETLQKNIIPQAAYGAHRGEARAPNYILPVMAQDADSLIVDLQGPHSGIATSGADSLAHLTRSLQDERGLRLKAEAIAASLAQRAKALKMKLSAIEAEKVARTNLVCACGGGVSRHGGKIQQQCNKGEELEHLRSVVGHLKSLYEMKEISLREVLMERDELWLEIQKYRAFR